MHRALLEDSVRMTSTLITDPSSAFEFNPSAPEFVPYLPGILPSGPTLSGDVPGTPCDAGETARRSAARRRSSAAGSSAQPPTLVVKNLPLDCEKSAFWDFLLEQGPPPTNLEFHFDAAGKFRGTAFVRFDSITLANSAFEKLRTRQELGGRRLRVEIQKTKGRNGLSQEDLGVVSEEVGRFLGDAECMEAELSPAFNAHQRKYAHSLAERHNLAHATRQGENGETYVYLSKARTNNGEHVTRQRAHTMGGMADILDKSGARGGTKVVDVEKGKRTREYSEQTMRGYAGTLDSLRGAPGLSLTTLSIPTLSPWLSLDMLDFLPATTHHDASLGLGLSTFSAAAPGFGPPYNASFPPLFVPVLRPRAESMESTVPARIDVTNLDDDFKNGSDGGSD